MIDVATNQYPGAAAFADGAFVAPEEAKVTLYDWGYTRSDATNDAASVWKGAFFRLDDHLDRFFAAGEIAHRHVYGYTGVLTVFRAGG